MGSRGKVLVDAVIKVEAVEYQDGVKLWTPRGEAVSRSQLWSTVLSVTERKRRVWAQRLSMNQDTHIAQCRCK